MLSYICASDVDLIGDAFLTYLYYIIYPVLSWIQDLIGDGSFIGILASFFGIRVWLKWVMEFMNNFPYVAGLRSFKAIPL